MKTLWTRRAVPALPLGPIQGDIIFVKPGEKVGTPIARDAPRLFVLLRVCNVRADRVFVNGLPLALFQEESGRQDGPSCAAAGVDKGARAGRQPRGITHFVTPART